MTTDSLCVQRRNVNTRQVALSLKSQRLHMQTGRTQGDHHQRPTCKSGCPHKISVHVFTSVIQRSLNEHEQKHKAACAMISTSKLQRGISGATVYILCFVSGSKHCSSKMQQQNMHSLSFAQLFDHMSCPLQRRLQECFYSSLSVQGSNV